MKDFLYAVALLLVAALIGNMLWSWVNPDIVTTYDFTAQIIDHTITYDRYGRPNYYITWADGDECGDMEVCDRCYLTYDAGSMMDMNTTVYEGHDDCANDCPNYIYHNPHNHTTKYQERID